MQMNPSVLVWWQWLLVGIGAWIICAILARLTGRAETQSGNLGCLVGILSWICGLIGLVSFGIAVIRLVR